MAEYKVEHALPTQQLMVDQNDSQLFEKDNHNDNDNLIISARNKLGKREQIAAKVSRLKNKWL